MRYVGAIAITILVVLGTIYLSGVNLGNNKEVIYKNVWINSVKDKDIECIVKGKIQRFKLTSKSSEMIKSGIADLVIEGDKVVKISIKPSVIKGKLIAVDNDYVELEGYGRVQVTKNCRMYNRNSGGIKYVGEDCNKLDIGSKNIEFIIEVDKICAAIVNQGGSVAIPNDISQLDIRVLLKDSSYSGIYHRHVELISKDDLEVIYATDGKNNDTILANKVIIDKKDKLALDKKMYRSTKIKPGQKFRITPSSGLFNNSSRIYIVNKNNRYGTVINSIKRANKGLSYRGDIEIVKEGDRLVVINELNIEDYLYAVVTSEMPESFHDEALKAQAICARTYAVSKIRNCGYKKYGAHLDDSISYQVYNNHIYGKKVVNAVNSTKGKVIRYNDGLAGIYYYSTSCGYSSKANDVFGGGYIPYLVDKYQAIDKHSVDNMYGNSNISKEDTFQKFILSTPGECFERDCEWFRWKMSVNVDKLSRAINSNLNKMNTGNGNIKVYDNKKRKYILKRISNIGKLQNIKIATRASGGMVNKILITGSKCRISVENQYTIRHLLAVSNNTIINKKGNKITNMKLLPSCYFAITRNGDKYVFNGGGYGHGVGMSQWGANILAKKGYNYDKILEFYFKNVTIR